MQMVALRAATTQKQLLLLSVVVEIECFRLHATTNTHPHPHTLALKCKQNEERGDTAHAAQDKVCRQTA